MDKDIEELLPFYALDALSDEERGLVERYLTEHPEARQQVAEMNETVSALPHSVSTIEPPQHVKEALMTRINAATAARTHSSIGAPHQPSRRRWSFESLFRVFSLGAAAVATIWVIALSLQVSQLRGEITVLKDTLAAQSESLQQVISKLPQTTPSDVITVSLRGTDVQPQAQGQLIADPKSQSAVLVIAGLPPLEPGRTYQVWLINGGAPVSAGLLAVDANGQAVFIVTSEESIGSFNSLGISVEPQGGSLQPTGEIVVLSDL